MLRYYIYNFIFKIILFILLQIIVYIGFMAFAFLIVDSCDTVREFTMYCKMWLGFEEIIVLLIVLLSSINKTLYTRLR